MRLLQINDHGGIVGGVESYIADLSELLESAGIEVIFLYGAPRPDDQVGRGRSRSTSPSEGDRILSRRALFCPELLVSRLRATERYRLRETIASLSPDVILCHQVESADVVELLCDLRPTVQFVHGQSRFVCPGRGKFYARRQEPCHRPFGLYCLIAPYRHACGSRRPGTVLRNALITHRWMAASRRLHRVMVASEYMKSELIVVGVAPEKIVVNPLFVRFHSTKKEQAVSGAGRGEREKDAPLAARDPEGVSRPSGDSQELPLVLFCGRMYDYKGAEYLLDALARVTVPVRAVFVGDGPERLRLQEKAARLGGGHQVDFTGWLSRDAVRTFYGQARVLVMPSLWPEPFGRVGIEALAEGAPVVAFSVGAIPEWLRDGETGFLVEPRNTRHLAEKIARLVSDDRLFHTMSARARAVVAESFSPQRHLQRWLDVLQLACEKKQ